MAGYSEIDAHRDPRGILEDFVAQVEGLEEVRSYEELQSIVTPDVTSALASVILKNGRPSKYPQSGNLATLNSKDGRRKVQGVVESGYEDKQPSTLYLAEFKRDLLRFKRKRWIRAVIEKGVSHGAAVDTEQGFYMPALHSDETISIYRDEIWERGSPETGLEMAGKAIRERSKALNSFLEVTASITRDLIRVVPSEQ